MCYFFQKNKKKTCCSLLLKEINCCAKKRKKNNLSPGKIPAPPPGISNGPSLIGCALKVKIQIKLRS